MYSGRDAIRRRTHTARHGERSSWRDAATHLHRALAGRVRPCIKDAGDGGRWDMTPAGRKPWKDRFRVGGTRLKNRVPNTDRADKMGVGGQRQKWEDRRDARTLDEPPAQARAQKRQPTTLFRMGAPKENATKEVGNVMNKRGHVSELHVQEIGGSYLATARFRQLSAGKLKCQRRPRALRSAVRSQKSEIGSQASPVGTPRPQTDLDERRI